MFLIRFIRFLRGYVIFSCYGGFPERFINLCSLNGINLWDAKSSGGMLTAKTTINGYKNIRPCAKKSGMKVKMSKKCGFPFFIKPYIRRKGLFAGFAISALMIAFFSLTVWTIDVEGNEKFTEEQIIAIAENYGIYPGAFRKNIDIKQIRSEIKSDIAPISWFSVNIDGSHVSLQVSESSGTNKIVDKTTPCNIVSGVDGELLKLDCYTGEPAVKPGSAVTKGDLLISGVEEKADGSVYFVHAKGNAVIRTNRIVSVRIPHNVNAGKINEIKKRYTVSIFSTEIPFSPEKKADACNRQKEFLTYKNKVLPIGVITDRYFYITEESIQLTENEAMYLACFSAFLQETEIMKNSCTENKNTKKSVESGCSFLQIEYINHETTGIEKYFEIDTTIY